jgi:NAD-dependent deacetylase
VNVVPEELASRLASAQHVVALTGSGISAESGVPTFRDAHKGLWARYQPEQLATPEAFERDPKLVWDWYAWRRDVVAGAEPNAAHHALVALAARVPRFTLVTQNVDGLHERAGSADVVEFHGNILRTRCARDCGVVAEPIERSDDAPPHCPSCGAFVRPDVVWFGEMIPRAALERAFAAAQDCDVFFSIGTSSAVYPAASLAEVATAAGAWLVEVNPRPTPHSRLARYLLTGSAGEIMPAVVAALEARVDAAAHPA